MLNGEQNTRDYQRGFQDGSNGRSHKTIAPPNIFYDRGYDDGQREREQFLNQNPCLRRGDTCNI